jgi:exosortase
MTTLTHTSTAKSLLQRHLLVILIAGLAGLILYGNAIATVMSQVINRSDSSHGVFVPFLTAFFLWTARDRIKANPISFSWAGVPLVIVCVVPAVMGIKPVEIQFIAFIGFICGIVLTLLGIRMFKTLAFPILFLVTMVPIPMGFYNSLADMSRTIAFGASLKILKLLQIPYVRSGWDVELPNAILNVAVSCSGIRYLISFVVFGLAYAYLFRSTLPGRIATLLATIPISLFASTCRLTIIFVMTYWVSPFWSQHRPHVILSWFVFFTVMFTCILVDQRVVDRRARGEER